MSPATQRGDAVARETVETTGEAGDRTPLLEREHGVIRDVLAGLRSAAPGVPLFPTLEGANAPCVDVRGRPTVNFAGYNYLGLAQHEEVLAAAHAAIDRFGTSASGSRLSSGQNPLHLELEEAIATFLGVDAALVFVGGHATNESVIGHLVGPEDVVVVDELSHNSILQGVALSGARLLPFGHNDVRRCARVMSRARPRHRRALLVVEGLYSMDGDVPDLAAYADLCDRYDVHLMVDEAHSFGVLGDGRGITAHLGVDPRRVDVLMGTLSKSLASCGGFIAGRSELVEYLRYTTPGFVFSVAPPPSVTAAARAALELVASGRAPFDALRRNCAEFHQRAIATGIPVHGAPDEPIMTVPMTSPVRCAVVAERLLDRGVLVQPVLYPAVARGAERLRLFITAAHTTEHIALAIDVLRSELASEVL